MSSAVAELAQPAADDLSLAEVMQALGDPLRLRIVKALAEDGERQCGSFELGITKATRSHHFKVLREAGITNTRIEGTGRFVTLRTVDLEERFPGLLPAILSASSQ